MLKPIEIVVDEPAALLGDPHPLVEQLGSAEGLAALSAVSATLHLGPVNDLPALRRFLRSYQAQILLPIELPAVHRAYQHAIGNELRELVGFDQGLATEPLLKNFADASQRVGRTQLRRFKPLRDHRFVQRYLQAVELREAHGWHTLVYGVTLAIYSLPLQQGLLNYALQTTGGFVESAARSLQLSGGECRELVAELSAELPRATTSLLKQHLLA